jgi:hypothetical protein
VLSTALRALARFGALLGMGLSARRHTVSTRVELGDCIGDDLADLAVEEEIEVLWRGGGVGGLGRRLGEAEEAWVDGAVEKGEDAHGGRC